MEANKDIVSLDLSDVSFEQMGDTKIGDSEFGPRILALINVRHASSSTLSNYFRLTALLCPVRILTDRGDLGFQTALLCLIKMLKTFLSKCDHGPDYTYRSKFNAEMSKALNEIGDALLEVVLKSNEYHHPTPSDNDEDVRSIVNPKHRLLSRIKDSIWGIHQENSYGGIDRLYRAWSLCKVLIRITSAKCVEAVLLEKLPTESAEDIVKYAVGPRYSVSGDIRLHNLRDMFPPWPPPKACSKEQYSKTCSKPQTCPARAEVRWSDQMLRMFHTHLGYIPCKRGAESCAGHFQDAGWPIDKNERGSHAIDNFQID